MADRRGQRRAAPKRTLIAPLVMLTCGVLTSALVWRLLTAEPRVLASHARP